MTHPRVRRLAVLVAAAAATAAMTVAATMTAHASAPSPPGGWNRLFLDDFNGSAGSGVDTGNWRYTTGIGYPGGPAHFGTDEVETMTSSPQNVSLDGKGNLRITAVNNGGWTSGRIETNRDDFQPPAGGKLHVEARVQMPDVTGAAAAGYWPAFWMLGAPYRGNLWNWPSVGEIDIMENVNGINREWATFHCGVSPGGPCNENTGRGNNVPCNGATCQGDFHTYAMEWDRSTNPEQLRWYLDGVQFHTVRATDVDPGTWANATQHGFFVIFDLAMGGQFPAALGGGPTGATASGKAMVVDYVGVWSGGATAVWGGGGPGPTPGPTPTGPAPGPTPTGPAPGPTPTGPAPGPTPTGGGGNRDAYGTIQAESANHLVGLSMEPCGDTGGGQDVGNAANGDYAVYTGVNFGSTPATQFVARAASGAPGGISGLVEVRLDSVGSAPIGSFAIANTGGWQAWRTVPANISGVTGVHTVYITYTSAQPAEYVNLNWFTFGH